MNTKYAGHTFHIPVMGIGYTIDTPVKVAQYGIDSVISLVDDLLIEKMRRFYCEKFNFPYQEITKKSEDWRAKRITAYLNTLDSVLKQKVDELKKSVFQKGSELEKYVEMLPDRSELKKKFLDYVNNNNLTEGVKWLKNNLHIGSIDVNIMTKLDREYTVNNEALPIEFNDAHAALRGFAESNLSSSVVLSAGMHPRLYSYCESFNDFYPNENSQLKKKIIIKVSDFRSAMVQGQFLAKKGLWVSEYRIESGLNCGGHAFATQGNLMGPILQEFKDNRHELIAKSHELFVDALKAKGKNVPADVLDVKFSAQGGVGTFEEHEFIMDHYDIDAIGWGTPFMLVPEITAIDTETLNILKDAGEEELILSAHSPLKVLFNTVKGISMDNQKYEHLKKGTPGRPCTKGHAAIFKDPEGKNWCEASRRYQTAKVKELDAQKAELSQAQYDQRFNSIIEKECICVGLGVSALKAENLDHKYEGDEISVCPGPNLAYFDKIVSLHKMVDHVYAKTNLIDPSKNRPNLFIKELQVYMGYLKKTLGEMLEPMTPKDKKYYAGFISNLDAAIAYYIDLFSGVNTHFASIKEQVLDQLEQLKIELQAVSL